MRRLLSLTGIWLLSLFAALPLVWMLMMSMRSRPDITGFPPRLLAPVIADNFVQFFAHRRVLVLLGNSLSSGVFSTVLAMCLALPMGFLFSRSRSALADRTLYFLLSTKMVPLIALSLPMFIVFTLFALRGTIGGLVVAQTVSQVPIAVWLLRAYFLEVPVEIFWAGQLDGLSALGSLVHTILPATLPAVSTTAGLLFIYSWNDYVLASLLTTSETRTLNAELPVLVTQGITQWGELAAGIVISTLPVIAVGQMIRRGLIEGLTLGAVKKA